MTSTSLRTAGRRLVPTRGDLVRETRGFLTSRHGVSLVSGTGALLLAISFSVGIATESLVALLIGLCATGLILAGGTLSVAWGKAVDAPRERSEEDKLRIMRARERACHAVTRMVGERHPAWTDAFTATMRIMEDAAAKRVGDDLALRLTDLNAAYEQAIAEAGLSDTTAIQDEGRNAVLAMIDGASAAREETRRAIKAIDDERGPDVARRFAQTARAVAGVPALPGALPPPSAGAALQMLIGVSEKALAVDPDLVDGAGARIDDLVRVHLPRLLEVHAAAARAAMPADLAAIDAALSDGVEQVRASIEEAMAADARRRFDLLRTCVLYKYDAGDEAPHG